MNRLLPWVGVALGVHGAAFAATEGRTVIAPAREAPLEIDLAELHAAHEVPALPPPPAMPDDEPASPNSPPPSTPPQSARPQAARAATPAAHVAKAGNLLTAGDATDASDATSFVTDPNGATFGFGVVARGGAAERGIANHVVAPPVVPRGPAPVRADGDVITPASDLRREPRLEEADACRGFFPSRATADAATVDLSVVVQASGRVARATIVRESTTGEGFGAAARTCLLSKTFSPGVDREGRSVTSAAAVRVHFSR